MISAEMVGKLWKDVTQEEKRMLLTKAYPVDTATGNTPFKSGECVVDLTNYLSIKGNFDAKTGEFEIDNQATIYAPQGAIASKDEVLANLLLLTSKEFNEDEIACAFEGYEEDGETYVIVSYNNVDTKIQNGDDVIECKLYNACIRSEDSTKFVITVSRTNNTIIDVWAD